MSNRLIVWVDLMGRLDCWSEYKGKARRFADFHEARLFAELHDFDGVKFKVARGYGLKPRIDRLMGGKKLSHHKSRTKCTSKSNKTTAVGSTLAT